MSDYVACVRLNSSQVTFFKAMTHQPTQLLSRVWSGPVGICDIGLQLDVFLHWSHIPDS